jgi:hypothetical protein
MRSITQRVAMILKAISTSQVTEFMIRKTPSLDRRELALARRLRDDADSHQTDRAGGAPEERV